MCAQRTCIWWHIFQKFRTIFLIAAWLAEWANGLLGFVVYVFEITCIAFRIQFAYFFRSHRLNHKWYKLSWNSHVNDICSKVLHAWRSFSEWSSMAPLKMRRQLIISLVMPILTYGDGIYLARCAADLLERGIGFNACLRYDSRENDSL